MGNAETSINMNYTYMQLLVFISASCLLFLAVSHKLCIQEITQECLFTGARSVTRVTWHITLQRLWQFIGTTFKCFHNKSASVLSNCPHTEQTLMIVEYRPNGRGHQSYGCSNNGAYKLCQRRFPFFFFFFYLEIVPSLSTLSLSTRRYVASAKWWQW